MPTPTNHSPRKKAPGKAAKKPLQLRDYLFPHKGNRYKPHLFRTASLTVIAVALVGLQLAYFAQINLLFTKTNFLGAVLPAALISLTNQDRAASDLAPVTEDTALDQVAQNVANDMAAKGYFAHVSPTGQSPWSWLQQAGYQYQFAGENLAVNFTDSEQVESAWMQSPTHRANIEKPEYTKVGIGVANGTYEGKQATFVVEYFATPPASGAPAEETPQVQEAQPAQTGTGEIALAPPQPSQAQTEALAAKKVAGITATQVLGTQTGAVTSQSHVQTPSQPAQPLSTAATATPTSTALAQAAPLPQAPSDPLAFAAQIVTSPSQTMLYILGTLALFVLILLGIEFFIKARMKYIEMTGGGLALLSALLVLMVFNFISTPHVLVSNDQQPVQTTSATSGS